jgi:hypothetical protein
MVGKVRDGSVTMCHGGSRWPGNGNGTVMGGNGTKIINFFSTALCIKIYIEKCDLLENEK